MDIVTDTRRSSPAALRNRDAILAVLRTALPATGRVLEIASGSGEHIVHFASHLRDLTWIPSDPLAEARASIAAWRAADDHSNILAPLDLDAASVDWPVDRAHAVLAINMVHISPWAATLGLIAGAARVLPNGGLLYLYGPYLQSGEPLAPSNVVFDADLRARNPAWGIRHLDDVAHEAARVGMSLEHVIDMPANNVSVIFRQG